MVLQDSLKLKNSDAKYYPHIFDLLKLDAVPF